MNNPISRTLPKFGSLQAGRRISLRERLIVHWLKKIAIGRISVEFPSGASEVFEGAEPGPRATLTIRRLGLVNRILLVGDMGFAEGYMAGEWDTPDLSALLQLGTLNEPHLSGTLGRPRLIKMLNRFKHARRANTRTGSRRNIAAHYDLGNAFYGLWLDETMSYSSGIFASFDEPMINAQRRKYLRLANKLALRPDDRVLEIGCGWGGFAEIAAKEYGCQVVCLTLSVEQAAYARARMAAAGLSDQVEIRVQDYRDVTGEFDKIVSIEMFEAVGEDYWGVYMDTLKGRLKPGGRAALQVITIDDDKFHGYREDPDFIQRYIFPGGMLPSPKVFTAAVKSRGLNLKDSFYFGKSYAETVRRWDKDFQANWPTIEALGFDQRFYRMWRYYLAYCEVGFDAGHIDVGQFVIERP